MYGRIKTIWICIRKAALPINGRVTIKVPEDIVGNVIEKNGKHVNQIIRDLGIKRLSVKSVSDWKYWGFGL